MQTIWLTVPCYDEARRLDLARLVEVLRDPRIHLVLVDDGSRDQTRALLEDVAARHPKQTTAIGLPRNRGKAEAVRAGLLEGLRHGATFVGFFDADLSTPPDEILRLVRAAIDSDAVAVLGSRVRMLGHDIQRQDARHYLGRVFATAASVAVDLPVYDSQCGAKVFRAGPTLEAALALPFRSRWVFDVELLARLVAPRSADVPPARPEQLLEVPLRTWNHRAGSKLTIAAMSRALWDLVAVAARRRGGTRRR